MGRLGGAGAADGPHFSSPNSSRAVNARQRASVIRYLGVFEQRARGAAQLVGRRRVAFVHQQRREVTVARLATRAGRERGKGFGHALAQVRKLQVERGCVRVAERARQAFGVARLRGQEVRLNAGSPLDGVLGPAQEYVGASDVAGVAIADEAAQAQPLERREGAAHAQARLLPAPNQLQSLDEELGLADAAWP